MPFTNPDSIHRAAAGATAPFQWGDTVNDDLNFLNGDAAWTNVSPFTNGWGAGTVTPGYILLGREVYLRGALTAGTANQAAFTLPAAYRPTASNSWFLAVATATTSVYLQITSAGLVLPQTSAAVWLNNISFPVV